MRTLKPWFLGIVVASGGFLACGSDGKNGSDGPAGTDAVVRVTAEEPGANCEFGGARIAHGLDDDDDGALDEAEVDGVSYACDGADGADGTDGQDGANGEDGSDGVSALVTDTAEPAGTNCANGGRRIDQGLDTDADDELDESEIVSTSYVCNGEDGEDGLHALVSVADEAPGAQCAAGGIALSHGIDDDDDGTLDAGEVDGVSYVCDGSDGLSGLDGLVNVTAEGASASCATGGVRVDFGLDDDHDGALDAGEIDGTRYVCNGATGPDGLTSLVDVTAVGSGADCANGGQRIEVGLDTDDSGTLDASEVLQTSFVCDGADGADGADGHHARIVVADVAPGATCAAGGKRIDVGVDADASGTLDPAEILQTEVVCAGVDGEDGADGIASLIAIGDEAPGANCANGGKRIDVGPDTDDDGTLDPAEIANTQYACNGGDGADGADAVASLVNSVAEPIGANCANGGQRLSFGLDDDDDGILDAGEVDGTRFVCNGAAGTAGTNGLNSLVSVVNEAAGANCVNGGERVSFGLDDDRDNILDAGEIDGTRFVCDGADGANGLDGADGLNSLISVTPEAAGATCANGGQRIESGLDDDGNGTLSPAEVDSTSFVCNGVG